MGANPGWSSKFNLLLQEYLWRPGGSKF